MLVPLSGQTKSCVLHCLLSIVCSHVLSKCLGKHAQLCYIRWLLIARGSYVDCVFICVQSYKARDVGWIHVCAVDGNEWKRFSIETLPLQTDTARLVTAFGTDDTVQFFKGQRFSRSLLLMRYRGPSDSTDPKIFFTYDLRLDNVSTG